MAPGDGADQGIDHAAGCCSASPRIDCWIPACPGPGDAPRGGALYHDEALVSRPG